MLADTELEQQQLRRGFPSAYLARNSTNAVLYALECKQAAAQTEEDLHKCLLDELSAHAAGRASIPLPDYSWMGWGARTPPWCEQFSTLAAAAGITPHLASKSSNPVAPFWCKSTARSQ